MDSPEADMGPVISKEHKEKIENPISIGEKGGAINLRW